MKCWKVVRILEDEQILHTEQDWKRKHEEKRSIGKYKSRMILGGNEKHEFQGNSFLAVAYFTDVELITWLPLLPSLNKKTSKPWNCFSKWTVQCTNDSRTSQTRVKLEMKDNVETKKALCLEKSCIDLNIGSDLEYNILPRIWIERL